MGPRESIRGGDPEGIGMERFCQASNTFTSPFPWSFPWSFFLGFFIISLSPCFLRGLDCLWVWVQDSGLLVTAITLLDLFFVTTPFSDCHDAYPVFLLSFCGCQQQLHPLGLISGG